MNEIISENAILRSTGESWGAWLERLNDIGAHDLTHKEIAHKLVTDYKVAGWWAQALTVRYEQAIGRRQPGQSNAGDYSVSVSKTLDGTTDEAMHWWLKKVQAHTDFNGISILSSSTTETEKWRNYRAALKDGSRVVVGIYAKTPTKAVLGLQHDKLPASEVAEVWRAYWKSIIAS